MSPPRIARGASALLAALLLVLVSAVVGAGAALAHTELESADPEPDAEVDGLERITLVYEGPLGEDGDHEIGLFDADTRLATGATQMEDGRTIAVDVPGPAPAAELTVRWVIVAADGDEQRGDYTFTLTQPLPVAEASPASAEPSSPPSADVAGAAPATVPTATADAASEPPAGRVDTTGPDDDEAGPVSAGALAVVALGAAAAVGAAIAAVRRRG